MKTKHIGRILGKTLFYFVILLFVLLSVYPFFWLVTTSMKTYAEAISWPPALFPEKISFESYKNTFRLNGFVRSIVNSFAFAGGGMILEVFFCSLAAYGFSRYNFRFKKLLFFIVLTTLMIPTQITMIPIFIILTELGWVDTYQGLIIPGVGQAFAIFLINQFAVGLPGDYFDAARIDGASEVKAYYKIFLPLCKPIISTLVVLEFVGKWNDLLWPLIVTNSSEMSTLTVLLTTAFRSVYDTYWNDLSAAMVLALIPIMILYVAFQKYFIEGISLSSGIKG